MSHKPHPALLSHSLLMPVVYPMPLPASPLPVLQEMCPSGPVSLGTRCSSRGLSWRWGSSWLIIIVWGRRCWPSLASGSLFSWCSWEGIKIRLINGRCPWPNEVLTVSCCRCPQLHNLSRVGRCQRRLPWVSSRSWLPRALATEVRRIDQRERTHHHSPSQNAVNFSKPLETNREIKVIDIFIQFNPYSTVSQTVNSFFLLLQALYLFAALLEVAIISLPLQSLRNCSVRHNISYWSKEMALDRILAPNTTGHFVVPPQSFLLCHLNSLSHLG